VRGVLASCGGVCGVTWWWCGGEVAVCGCGSRHMRGCYVCRVIVCWASLLLFLFITNSNSDNGPLLGFFRHCVFVLYMVMKFFIR